MPPPAGATGAGTCCSPRFARAALQGGCAAQDPPTLAPKMHAYRGGLEENSQDWSPGGVGGGGIWLDPASTGLCGRGGEPPGPSGETRAMRRDKHACRQKNQHTGRRRHDRVCTRMYVCVRVRAGPQATAQLHSDVPGEAAPACACTRVLAAHARVGANATWGDALPPPALPSHTRSWASVHTRLPRTQRPASRGCTSPGCRWPMPWVGGVWVPRQPETRRSHHTWL